MVAIEITQAIKDNNSNLNWVDNSTIGDIVQRNKIPPTWNSILNYGSINNSAMQIADGWKDFVIPTYDLLAQKLGGVILVEPNYTYEVIDLTQQELDDLKAEGQENNADNSFEVNIEDGRKLFSRSYRRMYRRFKDDDVNPNNVLVLSDVKKYMRWNVECYLALEQGNFYRAENRILGTLSDNAVELADNRPLEKMFEWLRDQIQDYILNKYDLV